MSAQSSKNLEAIQGLAAFIGITLGIIPLITNALGRGSALWKLALPDNPGAWGWIAPLLLLAAAGIVIAVAESKKTDR